MVPGLEDARVGEAAVLPDEAADVVGAGDDVGVAGGGEGVLVLVVHVQADLLAGDPCEEEEKSAPEEHYLLVQGKARFLQLQRKSRSPLISETRTPSSRSCARSSVKPPNAKSPETEKAARGK